MWHLYPHSFASMFSQLKLSRPADLAKKWIAKKLLLTLHCKCFLSDKKCILHKTVSWMQSDGREIPWSHVQFCSCNSWWVSMLIRVASELLSSNLPLSVTVATAHSPHMLLSHLVEKQRRSIVLRWLACAASHNSQAWHVIWNCIYKVLKSNLKSPLWGFLGNPFPHNFLKFNKKWQMYLQ